MTQYTIYATAANTVGNIVTVNSVGNMFSGLPIVFSGNTFGGITAGATYYIGAVIPGYPTSTITLSSLPGGAVYAVSNATGNMTAVFSSGGQQIINTVPPGESLTDAFTAVNVNFDQLFAAGPVNSNIQIANNTVLTTNTNGNINLVPNGIGAVVVNASLFPDRANIRNLGSNLNRFSTIYAQYLNVGNLAYTANTINANLIGSVYATNGGPIIVDADNNTITTDSVTAHNVTLDYLSVSSNAFTVTYGDSTYATLSPVGNSGAVQFNWQGSLSNQGGTPGDTYSTIQFDSDGLAAINGSTAFQQYNNTPYITVNAPKVESTDYGIVAGPGVTVVGYDDNYNTPRSAYLSVQDQAATTQQWDFGILGYGANSFDIRNSTANTIPLSIDPISDAISAVGNLTAGNISAVGNISGTYFIGDGRYISNITVAGGTKIVNGNSWANVETANGNVVINTNGSEWTFGTDSSLTAPGNISATGNVTGDYILGNIAFANGIPATYGNANVANYLPTFSGNLTAGNISVTGNVYGNNFIITVTETVTGNVTAGNILTGGLISATGNITGNYILGNVAFANGIPATYGNSDVANYLPTFLGNLTAGNISVTGNVIANIFSTSGPSGNITGANVISATTISASGNVTGDFILGNIAFANGIPATYGNANVANYLPTFSGNLTAGNISVTGNVTGNYFIGNGSQLTGLPATYGNANVATFLSAYGSNTISTTGNITAGNIIVGGTANTGVYALDVGAPAAFLSNTVSSFTANVNNYTQVTLQNLNTGADATADFILTANNGNDTVNYSDFGIINSGYDNATPTNSLGNIVFAADTYLYAQGNTGNASQSGGNLAIGTTVPGKNVKIFAGGITNSSIIANIGNTGVAVTGTLSATGNITTNGNFVGNGAALTNVTVSVAGNIVGTQANVGIVAGSYTWTFDNTGNVTLPAGGDINMTSASSSINVGGTVNSYGNTNGTAFAVIGNGAQSNVALGFFPTGNTPAQMAIRDYSTANSYMYFDATAGSANTGGTFVFRGSNAYTTYASINQYGVSQPTKTGFRVYGNGVTGGLNVTTNGNGVLNGNNWAVDYNQGSYLNSTTGVFAAPAAGLYQVNLVARVANNTAGASQAVVIKNAGTTPVNQLIWEVAANCTVNHFGVGTVSKLAVGDTLTLKVTVGNVTFDANDNWSVAFLG